MDNDDIISIVNNLIETCKDGEYGFQTSADYLQNPEIKRLFTTRGQQCREAASELQLLVRQFGGTAEEGGTVSGAMHRGWVAVKGTLSGYSERAILEEAERGEDAAIARYRDAMQEDLPVQVRSLIERQFEGVKQNHMQVRALRDQARLVAEQS